MLSGALVCPVCLNSIYSLLFWAKALLSLTAIRRLSPVLVHRRVFKVFFPGCVWRGKKLATLQILKGSKSMHRIERQWSVISVWNVRVEKLTTLLLLSFHSPMPQYKHNLIQGIMAWNIFVTWSRRHTKLQRFEAFCYTHERKIGSGLTEKREKYCIWSVYKGDSRNRPWRDIDVVHVRYEHHQKQKLRGP